MTMPQKGLPLWAKRLRELRAERPKGKDGKPFSRRAFAKLLGKSRGIVQFWEKGLREPGRDSLLVIAEKCDVTFDWASGDPDAQKHPNQQRTVAKLEDDLGDSVLRALKARGPTTVPVDPFPGDALLAVIENAAVAAAEEDAANIQQRFVILDSAITVAQAAQAHRVTASARLSRLGAPRWDYVPMVPSMAKVLHTLRRAYLELPPSSPATAPFRSVLVERRKKEWDDAMKVVASKVEQVDVVPGSTEGRLLVRVTEGKELTRRRRLALVLQSRAAREGAKPAGKPKPRAGESRAVKRGTRAARSRKK